jgi:hypothetical protein
MIIYKHSKDQRLICPMGLWDLTLKPLSWERILARQRRGFNQELNNKDWGKKSGAGYSGILCATVTISLAMNGRQICIFG